MAVYASSVREARARLRAATRDSTGRPLKRSQSRALKLSNCRNERERERGRLRRPIGSPEARGQKSPHSARAARAEISRIQIQITSSRSIRRAKVPSYGEDRARESAEGSVNAIVSLTSTRQPLCTFGMDFASETY